MIEIRNSEGLTAHLYDNTSIEVEKNNPIFNDDDKLFEDITYSFSLPLSEQNKAFFNNGHLVEADSSVYEMNVFTIVSGLPFFAGSIRYSFVKAEYQALLKVNFGALKEKVSTVKLCEIYTADAGNSYNGAIMKTVCQNPLSYPYSFFPVYNEKWDKLSKATNFTVNPWDHASQSFLLPSRNNNEASNVATTPFWKLKYILIKTMNYLGFQCEGGFISDPDSEQIYIYTQLAIGQNLLGSTSYLPRDLTIADFLKIIKSRFKISCSFNTFSGLVQIESGKSILSIENLMDLKDYVTSVDEISTNDLDGYSINLKPDNTDELFLDPLKDKVSVPSSKMVINNGEKKIELDCSTLKSKAIADYSMPQTKQNMFIDGNADGLNWPLRFLKYNGMKSVAGGKVFPEATSMELTLEDGGFYKFLNDSKTLNLQAQIPVGVLSNINSAEKIGFYSNEGTYSVGVIEKISYSLGNDRAEFINAKIICRSLTTDYNTTIIIEPYLPQLGEEVSRPKFKAFFNTDVTGLTEVDFEVFYPYAIKVPMAIGPVTDIGNILKSTDSYGAGGSNTNLNTIQTPRRSEYGLPEIRVRNGDPKYIVIDGLKIDFTKGPNFSFVTAKRPDRPFNGYDGLPVWIVF